MVCVALDNDEVVFDGNAAAIDAEGFEQDRDGHGAVQIMRLTIESNGQILPQRSAPIPNGSSSGRSRADPSSTRCGGRSGWGAGVSIARAMTRR
ncbi:hypothetical protein BH24ACI5_BH24ACI5_27480 [soil metagenome]